MLAEMCRIRLNRNFKMIYKGYYLISAHISIQNIFQRNVKS